MSPLQPWLRYVVPLVLLAPVAPVEAFPANLRPIADALEKRGWKVLLKQPPRKGIYGLANSKKKPYGFTQLLKKWALCPRHLFTKLFMLCRLVRLARCFRLATNLL